MDADGAVTALGDGLMIIVGYSALHLRESFDIEGYFTLF